MRLPYALRHVALTLSLVSVPVAAASAPEVPDIDALLRMPLGYAALTIEEAAGVEVDDAAAALDRVVGAVRPRLLSASPREALQTIAEAVPLACPSLVNGTGDSLISEALRTGGCDCDVLVVVYLTVADVLGLPLSAVFLPGHALVVWDDGRTRVYWETTAPEERPAWFVEALVPEGAEQTYLRAQSKREMIGYFHQVRASYRIEVGAPEAAFADYNLAARLNPTFPLTFSNRGRAYLLAGRYAPALVDFDRALRLDPTLGDALYGRGLALVALDRPVEALEVFGRVSVLEGPAADVLHAEGLAFAALGEDTEALERYDEAIALDPEAVLVYEARGALYERRGDTARARRDYLTFLHLAPGTPHAAAIPEVRERLDRLGAA